MRVKPSCELGEYTIPGSLEPWTLILSHQLLVRFVRYDWIFYITFFLFKIYPELRNNKRKNKVKERSFVRFSLSAIQWLQFPWNHSSVCLCVCVCMIELPE